MFECWGVLEWGYGDGDGDVVWGYVYARVSILRGEYVVDVVVVG